MSLNTIQIILRLILDLGIIFCIRLLRKRIEKLEKSDDN